MNHEASTLLPTEFGTFRMHVYRNQVGHEVTAICAGEVFGQPNVPVRVHSACFTAETLGSLKCDCKQQLDYALNYIADHGGAVLYLPQEGRGIGLSNKIKAYALQEKGHDTIEANRMLGLPIDARTYEDAKGILDHLGVESIKLLTNNPKKLNNLRELGVRVVGRLPVICDANQHSAAYLDTKKRQMGHMLDSPPEQARVVPIHSKRMSTRPFIHINLALTDESRTFESNGAQLSISCDTDWQRVHQLREKYDAIAVGANTWIRDQPRLTARPELLGREANSQPARVIFAGAHDCQIQSEANNRLTYIIGQPHQMLSADHVVIATQNHHLGFPLQRLRECGIESILVEGGLQLINSFLGQDVVDLLTIYVKSDCVETAKASALKVIPKFCENQILAEQYGQGTLLTVALQSAGHSKIEGALL